jgi:D-serine deaminase-like pyridoxal phosphate-dependent protein
MAIHYPFLLLDKQKCLQNIGRMADKAKRLGLKLRPHFKTHQSAEIGEWFREFGTDSCTVSSLKMAEYFKQSGWKDITLAFPLNPLEIEKLNHVASGITFNQVAVSPGSIQAIKESLREPVGIFIKINTGANRTGIEPSNKNLVNEILQRISENPLITFKGFLAHSGQTYNARSQEEIEAIHAPEIWIMADLKEHYKEQFPELEISVGDTPACSISENYKGIDEIRPGNYVYYDLMQAQIGSCTFKDIAIALACPVVAKHPERNEIIIHGGAVHLSKDYIVTENGEKNFGLPVKLNQQNKWQHPISGLYLKSLSQEHGIIKAENPEAFNSIEEGDVIGILPVHSCLTADMAKELFTTEGKKIEMMKW